MLHTIIPKRFLEGVPGEHVVHRFIEQDLDRMLGSRLQITTSPDAVSECVRRTLSYAVLYLVCSEMDAR